MSFKQYLLGEETLLTDLNGKVFTSRREEDCTVPSWNVEFRGSMYVVHLVFDFKLVFRIMDALKMPALAAGNFETPVNEIAEIVEIIPLRYRDFRIKNKWWESYSDSNPQFTEKEKNYIASMVINEYIPHMLKGTYATRMLKNELCDLVMDSRGEG